MKLFLLILLVIIFIPIPLKIEILLTTDNYYIKFYKFNILEGPKKKNSKIKSEEKKTIHKTKKSLEKTKKKKLPNLKKRDIIYFAELLKGNKFKPSLKINGNINYSIGDAGKDALLFGIFHSIMPLVTRLFSIVFKVKKFNIPIKPLYKDNLLGEIKANSIILVSLAQIIYIAFLLFNGVVKLKGGEME